MVVLGLVNLYLLVHMAVAWRAANSENAQALAQQTVAMKTAEIARQPLEGLDEKLAQATTDADKFYKQRLPFADSEVAGELGALAKKQGVKLTRVQYADVAGAGGDGGRVDGGPHGRRVERGLPAAGAVHECAGAGQDVFPDHWGDVDGAAERDGGAAVAVDDVSAVSGGG